MQVGLGLGKVGSIGCGEERGKGEKKKRGNYVLGCEGAPNLIKSPYNYSN